MTKRMRMMCVVCAPREGATSSTLQRGTASRYDGVEVARDASCGTAESQWLLSDEQLERVQLFYSSHATQTTVCRSIARLYLHSPDHLRTFSVQRPH